MKKYSSLSRFFLALLFSSLSSTIFPRSFNHFPVLDTAHACEHTSGNLTITAQLFTHRDCKKYFGVDLIRKGIRPLVVRITNTSDRFYTLTPTTFSLDLVPSDAVAAMISFPVIPFALAAGSLAVQYHYKTLPVIGLVALGFRHYNQKVKGDLLPNTIDPETPLKIAPYKTVTKFLFCDEAGFLSKFTVTITDEHSKENADITIDLLQKNVEQNLLFRT